MNLHWIHEPAMQPVDGDERIYSEVITKRPDYLVAIYEGAEIDPALTARDGRNRYRNCPMICIRIKGEKDFISEPLREEHARRFPRASRWWEQNRGTNPKVSVRLLPGIGAADLMELEELNLMDIASLAAADVPENLARWRELSRRFLSLSKPRMRLVDGQLQEVA